MTRDREIEVLQERLDRAQKAAESLREALAAADERATAAERRGELLVKALLRAEGAGRRQRELTGIWHARYQVVKHENNQLRKKLYPRREKSTGA